MNEISNGDASSPQLSPLYVAHGGWGRHHDLRGSQYPRLTSQNIYSQQSLVKVTFGNHYIGEVDLQRGRQLESERRGSQNFHIGSPGSPNLDLLTCDYAQSMGGRPFLGDYGDGGSGVDHQMALGRRGLPFIPLGLSSSGRLDGDFDVGLLDRIGRRGYGLGG